MEYAHPLADDEKRELLRIARATLREYAFSGRIPPGKPHRESLCAPAAVVVNLYLGDAARGRGSDLSAAQPLYRAIQTSAVAALAVERPTPLPLAETRIEIAVLGVSRPLASLDQLVGGDDGVWLERRGSRTVLVPPASARDPLGWLRAPENHGDLTADDWRVAIAHAFRAQVFSDATHPRLPDPVP